MREYLIELEISKRKVSKRTSKLKSSFLMKTCCKLAFRALEKYLVRVFLVICFILINHLICFSLVRVEELN